MAEVITRVKYKQPVTGLKRAIIYNRLQKIGSLFIYWPEISRLVFEHVRCYLVTIRIDFSVELYGLNFLII